MPAPEPTDSSFLEGIWDGDTREMSRARETSIGPYRIHLRLGDGGMGIVYQAFDAKLERFVAIKVLKEKLAQNERYVRRLSREARAVASLSHPNVVQIYSFEDGESTEDRLPYLVMEFIDGQSVESRLKRGERFSVGEALDAILEAARGLQAALERGIIHRDVKPSNLLQTRQGTLKIVDFGLAKAMDGGSSITDEGIVLGTPHYISPEQGQGEKVDHRSDIYSLGATLYHMLTGKPVFDGESHATVIYRHIHDTPVPPHKIRGEIPEPVSQLIGKMLAKNVEDRYGSYPELIADLERLREHRAVARQTARAGHRTYSARNWKTSAAFWFVAGLAFWSCLAIVLVLILSWIPPARSSPAASLAEFITPVAESDDQELLSLDFTNLASRGSEKWFDRLFAWSPDGRPAPRPDVRGRVLSWTRSTGEAALRIPIARLEELKLLGLRLRGEVDLGVELRHPAGQHIRSLQFAFSGDREIREPIRALRNAELSPEEQNPLLPLTGELYEVTVRTREEKDGSSFSLTVRNSQGMRIYEATRVLEGKNWSRGVLVISTDSPWSQPSFSVSIQSLRIQGRLAREEWIQNVPEKVRA